MSSRFIHVVACVRISFLFFKAEWYSLGCIFCLFIHLSINVWVVLTFWLLWITLLWTLVYKYLPESLPSVPLCIYQEVELLDQMVILCLIFEELPHCFPQQLHHLIFPPAIHKDSNFSTSTPTLVFFFDNSHPHWCEIVYYILIHDSTSVLSLRLFVKKNFGHSVFFLQNNFGIIFMSP